MSDLASSSIWGSVYKSLGGKHHHRNDFFFSKILRLRFVTGSRRGEGMRSGDHVALSSLGKKSCKYKVVLADRLWLAGIDFYS